MKFVNIHCHTHLSLLDSIAKPKQIAQKCVELGYNSCGISDHGSLSGCIAFYNACKEASIKPILGIEAYIALNGAANKTSEIGHQLILAKNLNGWRKLIKLVSQSNDAANFYYKPRIDLNMLQAIQPDGDLISISGHPSSTLDVHHDPELYVSIMKDLFGRENFFIEIQRVYGSDLPFCLSVSERMRYLAKQTDTQCVATGDSHYINKEDAELQRLMLCSSLKTTMGEVAEKRQRGDKVALDGFFLTDKFHIPSINELVECGNTEEEINNSQLIADMCEEYNITSKPRLPKFEWTEGLSEKDFLIKLCREGMVKYKYENKPEYEERLTEELNTLLGAGLEGYFLIVQDYVNWAKRQGWLIASGRGCLSPTTKIVCQNGQLKNIQDININDYVLSNNGQYNKVLNKYEYDCHEDLINFKTFYGYFDGISVTHDHKMLINQVVRPKNYNNWSEITRKSRKQYIRLTDDPIWMPASQVKIGDYIAIPRPKVIQQKHTFDLAKYSNDIDIRNDNEYSYFEPNNYLCKTKMFSKRTLRFIKLDKSLSRIIGIFCGDGWFHYNAICFCFHSNDTENIQFVDNYFKNISCQVRIRKHKQQQLVQMYVYHKSLVLLFRDLFNDYKNTSKTKHVPQILFSSEYEIISSFLKGYCSADGHIEQYKITFCTISYRLATEIRFLLWCIGLPASIRLEDRIGYKNIINISYYISCPRNNLFDNATNAKGTKWYSTDSYIFVNIRKISTITNTSNKVYDIQVDNTYNYCTSNGIVHNSAGGCLVSQLIGITTIDPIKNKLIFSRFYNSGRNTKDKVSLPDIDVDFPTYKRPYVIEYIRNKYGRDKVCNMATFGRMQGRGAIKEVLRVNNACTAEEMNEITRNIKQEAEIVDLLQESGEESILQWTLHNEKGALKEWCEIDENNNLTGLYAKYFDQAIKLEGVYRTQGKHAAGIIISKDTLADICPMIRDKDGDEKIAGLDMHDCETIGLVKMDILSTTILDKLMGVNDLLMKGKIDE